MSQFYTNIQLAGDTILYRGYQDGTPVQFRTKFSPTLYVPSKKNERYKTLDGRSVAPMEFSSSREAREFIKKRKLKCYMYCNGANLRRDFMKKVIDAGCDSIKFSINANNGEDFKKVHGYDDFEKVPLHGSFLVDASGDVRWQDVSHEPFTKIDFLLKEAKRLLANDSAKNELGVK